MYSIKCLGIIYLYCLFLYTFPFSYFSSRSNNFACSISCLFFNLSKLSRVFEFISFMASLMSFFLWTLKLLLDSFFDTPICLQESPFLLLQIHGTLPPGHILLLWHSSVLAALPIHVALVVQCHRVYHSCQLRLVEQKDRSYSLRILNNPILSAYPL